METEMRHDGALYETPPTRQEQAEYDRQATEAHKAAMTCRQSGAPMNPVAWMMGPVCGQCCRENQKAVTG